MFNITVTLSVKNRYRSEHKQKDTSLAVQIPAECLRIGKIYHISIEGSL